MQYAFNIIKVFLQKHSGPFLLTGTFLLGFSFGRGMVFNNADLYTLMLYEAAVLPVTGLAVFLIVFFLFLLTAIILFSGKTQLFCVLCLIQSFLFGVSTTAVSIAYGSSQWLICHLLLFTATISFVSLLCLWFRQLSPKHTVAKREFLICFAASIIAAGVDRYFVAPFLIHLLI